MQHATLPVSRLALNLITVGTEHPLERILDLCAAHGIRTVSLWQSHFESLGVSRAAELLRARGIAVATICRMSGFGSADDDASWQTALGEARQLVEQAVQLSADSITVIGGGLSARTPDLGETRQRIIAGITEVLPHARSAGVTLALEPLHPMVAAERGAVNTIAQAAAIARQFDGGVGVMLDAYNTWWDPALEVSIADCAGLVSGLQVSDWLVPTRDLAFDRGMMGDGVIDIRHIRTLTDTAGYNGPIEVEILSSEWSKRDPDQVIRTVVERFTRCC